MKKEVKMKVYNYNIRCKSCSKGFNPKDKQNIYTKLCPKCYKKRAKAIKIYELEKKKLLSQGVTE
jgi:Zn finger protein HypA/HybF involved in hydrogenase expression